MFKKIYDGACFHSWSFRCSFGIPINMNPDSSQHWLLVLFQLLPRPFRLKVHSVPHHTFFESNDHVLFDVTQRQDGFEPASLIMDRIRHSTGFYGISFCFLSRLFKNIYRIEEVNSISSIYHCIPSYAIFLLLTLKSKGNQRFIFS